MTGYYTLIGQTPVLEPNLFAWGRWFEAEDRRVAITHLLWADVSTVFLGIDHNFCGGPPLLFESMVFWDGDGGYEQDRCSTWAEAEAMHAAMVREVSSPRAVLAWVRRVAATAWRGCIADLRALGSDL